MDKKFLIRQELFKTYPHWTLLEFLSLVYGYYIETVERFDLERYNLFNEPNCDLYCRAIRANVKPVSKNQNDKDLYSPFDILEFFKEKGFPVRPELEFTKKTSESGKIQYTWASDEINEPLKTNKNHIFQREQITSWEDLEIILTSYETVTIKTQNDTTKFSFNELGMAHKENPGRPKEVWQTLMFFALLDGKYPNSDVPEASLKNAKDRVKEFNETLKDFFILNESIYKHHYKKHRCWETKFRISSQLETNLLQENHKKENLNSFDSEIKATIRKSNISDSQFYQE